MNNLDPKTFYFAIPLYSSIDITEGNRIYFLQLLNYIGKIDEYNPTIKEKTTYAVRPLMAMKNRGAVTRLDQSFGELYLESGSFEFSEIVCLRTGEVFYIMYYYDLKAKTFMKIGQYPSIADLHISQVKNYDKILNKEQLKEFTRSIGLAANGVGIGSFVYLRRIFESLIEDAHQLAAKDGVFNEDKYTRARMDEKIEILENYLPQFLVENKMLYSILSKGIHELSENECLINFETVRVGIELILDEKLIKHDRDTKIAEAKKRISNTGTELSKK